LNAIFDYNPDFTMPILGMVGIKAFFANELALDGPSYALPAHRV
jgi:hypothetical protein